MYVTAIFRDLIFLFNKCKGKKKKKSLRKNFLGVMKNSLVFVFVFLTKLHAMVYIIINCSQLAKMKKKTKKQNFHMLLP